MKSFYIFITILLCSSCSILSQDRNVDNIILTEQIFIDTQDRKVSAIVDNTLDNLKKDVIFAMQQNNVNIVEGVSNANVLLKVKTTFHGRVLSSKVNEVIDNKIAYENIESSIKKYNIEQKYEKTTIDKLIEDPSGMVIGFAIGASVSNPIVFAPIGMALGAAFNMSVTGLFKKTTMLTVLDVEIHEKAKKPLWYTDKRIHKKDEYSIRKYEYSEETNWKVYKTRVIIYGNVKNNEVAKRIASLVV
jgi:hypothetical protein